ncbi:cytochrome c biogenesis protein CcsA [Paludibacter sp.]
MIDWDSFIWYALPAAICWLCAGSLIYSRKPQLKIIAHICMITGIAIFTAFITGFWISSERPPMRTMGETRLWYSFFLALTGYIAFIRWKYPWLLSFSALVAIVFIMINLLKPEIHSKNLMPALQSSWFVPHVVSYILSYSMLGAATIASIIQLRAVSKKGEIDKAIFELTDNLVYVGFGFLVAGMLMGAVWAKEAWGHYWEWDPKETWAFITVLGYLAYIHIRLQARKNEQLSLWLLIISFILLMITWIGVNYLPAAQGSVHVY